MSAPDVNTSKTAEAQQPTAVSDIQSPSLLSEARTLETLTVRRDFLSAARAKRASAPAFLLQARLRHEGESHTPEAIRIGYTCSKKVGNAVARNRAKRRLREIARAIIPTYGQPGWDYVLIGRAEKTAQRDFVLLKSDLVQAIRQIHKRASKR